MRVKLRLNSDKRESIRMELEKLEIEVSEDADLILTEGKYNEGELLCRSGEELFRISFDDILYIESLGKDVFVYTRDRKLSAAERLFILENTLPAEKFLRISNSVIINRASIKKVRPALCQKFYLTLENDVVVDVTRSYYVRFKDYFGI